MLQADGLVIKPHILNCLLPGRYLVVMSTTDCSKEEGMCLLVDAVSLLCLNLGIRSRNMKAK